MYLRTRLLFGIGTVTLVALLVSLLVPLESIRGDVARETDASMQLAQLLLDVQHAVARANGSAEAMLAATGELRRANNLRHVRVSLVDNTGALLATSPVEEPQVGMITKALLSSGPPATLAYPVSYRAIALGELRVSSNPLSEFAEIEQRVGADVVLLALTVLALSGAIYWMVRRGLQPIAQVQAALANLQAGQLGTRLPRFRLKDVDDISQRFNQCAAAMEEAAAQRRDSKRLVLEAEEEERKRLARELHDELGQSLTAIKVDAAYIARAAANSAPPNNMSANNMSANNMSANNMSANNISEIVACANSIEKLSTNIMELIRSMLARLRPYGLETVGLRETIHDLVNGWQVRVADRFQCSLEFLGAVDSLPADLNMTLYRLIQECLTNAVKHSRARKVDLRLALEENRVLLEVTESETTGDAAVGGGSGSGLLGMRERVEVHGGELNLTFDPKGGLSLRAWMPCA
jgi:two-component system, NarL family, sensor histidine kinase UhpB